MVDFAPKLQTGVAFNQPVTTPNAMSAVADLFNFGVSTLQKASSGQDKLTEDEKFAVAVKEFEGEKGATFKWDRKGVREFIFKHPQFTDQAKTYGENLGVMTASPLEASRDSIMDWAKTPEGTMAAAVASGMSEEEGTAYLSEQFTKQKQQEAEIAKLQRNAAQLEAEGTLQSKQWDALKPTQKSMVDSTVQTVIGPIVQEVMNGVTVEVPPELQAMLGVRYDKVDMANLPALLQDAKIALSNNARSAYGNSFGSDGLPSEQWNKDVFSSLDALIEVGKAIDTPQERAAAMQGLIETRAYETMDAAGVAVAVNIFKNLPPDIAATLLGEVPGLSGRLSGVLAPSSGGELFPTKTIAENVSKLSTTEADQLATETIKIIEKNITPEFFTAFKEAAKRNGYNVVDSASYKAIVGDNLNEIKRLTTENPEFRAEFSDWLVGDIQQTISSVQSNLPAGLVLSSNGGKFIVTAGPDFNWTGFNGMNSVRKNGGQSEITIQQYIQDQIKDLPGGMTVDTLNEKVSALPLMGDVGSEVQGAVGILNTEPKGDKKPVRGGQPPRGRGRGRGAGPVIESGNFVVDGLVSRGMPQHIAEGFAMNVKDESNFNPTAVGDGGNAYGLAQWNGPRKRALETYAASVGGDVSDPEVQMDFLMHELETNEAGSWAKIQGATTAGEAAALIVNHYERPAESHRARREAAYLGGQSVGPAGAPVSVAKSTPTVNIDSQSVDAGVMQSAAAGNTPVESLRGTVEALQSPEVQQIVEKATSAPEEALALAKEILSKPIDPMIKSLIEALVKVGERA